jgi:hypothetical protein
MDAGDQKLIETKDRGRILNVNETCWWLSPTGIPTRAEAEAEVMSLKKSGDLQVCVTVLVIISADMQKLQLVIVAA